MFTTGITLIQKTFVRLFEDSLFRNSFYLMLATTVTAGFGFLFWLISSHLYPVEHIGIATTLISVMNLIALLSLMGFDSTLVRFLPNASDRNEKMNVAILLVSITSLALSIGFVFFVRSISPSLSFIQDHPWYFLMFIFSCVMNALNVLTDAIFLAEKKTAYTLSISTVASIVKVAAPFAFIGFGAIGIFVAAGVAQTVATVASLYVLIAQFQYRPSLSMRIDVLKSTWQYSGVNYATSILNLLPPTLLPILIINTLGAEVAAYFYIVMMLGNLLYTIPWSASKSLFAESSHDTGGLAVHTARAIRTITTLAVPAMLILFIFGKLLLSIFGERYATGGTLFLYIVTATVVFVSVNSIYGSIFKVRNDLRFISIGNIVYVASIFFFLYFFLPLGLTGVGFAWFLGTALMSATNALLYHGSKRKVYRY